jgi:hypothetical protein
MAEIDEEIVDHFEDESTKFRSVDHFVDESAKSRSVDHSVDESTKYRSVDHFVDESAKFHSGKRDEPPRPPAEDYFASLEDNWSRSGSTLSNK